MNNKKMNNDSNVAKNDTKLSGSYMNEILAMTNSFRDKDINDIKRRVKCAELDRIMDLHKDPDDVNAETYVPGLNKLTRDAYDFAYDKLCKEAGGLIGSIRHTLMIPDDYKLYFIDIDLNHHDAAILFHNRKTEKTIFFTIRSESLIGVKLPPLFPVCSKFDDYFNSAGESNLTTEKINQWISTDI